MKKIFLFFITISLLLAGNGLWMRAMAQKSKMNFGAALLASNPSMQENNISLLVKGNAAEIKKYVEQTGGAFIYSTGDISSVTLKVKYIKSLSEKTFVKRMEARSPFSKLQPLNDSMLVNNRVVAVHAGNSPLTQPYKGNGVVLGFIDTGIDFTHPDFIDSTGKSRIKFLWDQNLPDSVPPQPYNYGQEWTGADIDSGKASAHLATAATYGGHGTHVASHAAGNGRAVNHFEGVAPDADIIFVGVNFNDVTHSTIVDATDYIYSKAALLGKPCSINCSLGDYYGSHDGTDLQAQGIKTLITAQNGRSFSAAAGNCGTCVFHLGYTVSNTDTNFTWFKNSSSAYIAIYADTGNFKNVQFAIGADKVSSYSFRGNIPFSNIIPHLGNIMNDTIWNGSNRLCTIQSYGDMANGVYSLEYVITPDSASYNWRLMTTGTGKFDCWTFDVVSANMADTTLFPPLKKYKQPDLNQNIVTSFQCLDEVITVGSYINRNQFIDYDTILVKDTTLIPGALSNFSSHGPTRDGKIKPDITSPGQWVFGSMVSSLFNNYAHTSIAKGGYHINGNGTSYASPSVAGIAGLYLQMDPSADWQAVKNVILNCARKDSFTGTNLPDNFWGYGKADAFNSLTGCVTSVNNNQNSGFEELMIYPNPCFSEATIEINMHEKTENAELKIYDVVGKEIKAFKVKNSEPILFRKENIPDGIYFCTLRVGEKIIAVKKLIISE